MMGMRGLDEELPYMTLLKALKICNLYLTIVPASVDSLEKTLEWSIITLGHYISVKKVP